MAQVTMDSREYLELVDKARKLDALEKDMVENIEVTVDEENRYSHYNIRITPTFSTGIVSQVISKVVKTLLTSQVVMTELVEENRHFLNMCSGNITYNWDDKPEENEMDLLQNKEFRAMWENIKKDMEAKQEEE